MFFNFKRQNALICCSHGEKWRLCAVYVRHCQVSVCTTGLILLGPQFITETGVKFVVYVLIEMIAKKHNLCINCIREPTYHIYMVFGYVLVDCFWFLLSFCPNERITLIGLLMGMVMLIH